MGLKPFIKILPSFLLITFLAAWTLAFREIYWVSYETLPADNFTTHLNLFAYIAAYLRNSFHFPDWVVGPDGGMWMAPLSNNYLTLAPWRWMGYLLAWTQVIPVNLAYKISFLIFGVFTFLAFLFLLAKKIFQSTSWACFLVGVAFFSSPHIGLFHQEQVLGTTFFLPVLAWLCFYLPYHPWILVLMAGISGFALNIHYPHLLVFYGLGFLMLLLILKPQPLFPVFHALKSLAGTKKGQRVYLLAALSFILGASPLIYAYVKYHRDLVSPFRNQKNSLEAASYAEYLELNRQQLSSVRPDSFKLYLGLPPSDLKGIAPLDMKTFFLSPALLAGLCAFLVFGRNLRLFLVGSSLWLVILSLGLYGPLFKIFWTFVPGMALFRQWYHFIPILNLQLLILFVLGLKAFVESYHPGKHKAFVALSVFAFLISLFGKLPFMLSLPWLLFALAGWKVQESAKKRNYLFVGLVIWAVGFSFFWAVHNLNDIHRYMSPKNDMEIERTAQADFFQKAFVERRGVSEPLHAILKAADSEDLRRLEQRSGIYWVDEKGSYLSEALDQVFVHPEGSGWGFEWHHRPEKAKSLSILQHQDGFWQTGSPLSQAASDAYGMISIPVSQTERGSFRLERENSFWFLWVLLSFWGPVLCTLGARGVLQLESTQRLREELSYA